MSTDQIIDTPCYECGKPFTVEQREACHDQHSEWCNAMQTGDECECERHSVHDVCCIDCNGRLFAEVRIIERGHPFYPRPVELDAIPALYKTERQPIGERIVHLHYFTSGADWWVIEFNPSTGVAFGYACLGDPHLAEWGNVYLPELEELYVPMQLAPGRITPPILVERDLSWTPKPAKECNLPGRGVNL